MDLLEYTSFLFLQERTPSPNTVDYICDVLYNAFYSFEALTQSNMDDVVCGLCGTEGEVYYGDGNSKNSCTVKGVSKIYIIIMFNSIIP